MRNFLAIDDELMEFLSFARSRRQPVTRSFLQERARLAAIPQNIPEFEASNGYVQKVLGHNPVQKSIRLQRKGNAFIPIDHTICMQELRATMKEHPAKIVYNMDETGLFLPYGTKSHALASK